MALEEWGELGEDIQQKLYDVNAWKERRKFGLGTILTHNAETYPDRLAIVDSYFEKSITFDQLNKRVNALANGLKKMGVRKGDLVSSLFYNNYPCIEVMFAAYKVGALHVPINFRFVPQEYIYLINNSRSNTLIFYDEFLNQVEQIRPSIPRVKNFICMGANQPPWALNYDEVIESSPTHEPPVDVYIEEPCVVGLSGGTTGPPKAIIKAHLTILLHVYHHVIEAGIPFHVKTVNAMPLYNLAGLHLVGLSTYVVAGVNIIPKLRNFDAEHILQLIEKYQGEYFCLVPAMGVAITNFTNLSKYPCKSLRLLHTTASYCPMSLKEKLIAQFPHARLIETYGLNEGSQQTILRAEDHLRKPGSVGRQYVLGLMRIVDENGNELPRGKVGEIISRNGYLGLEYYQNPAATKETWRPIPSDPQHHWLYTGDVGKIDEEGYLYILDRKKDMIISGGANVYSSEVEEVLFTNPKIREVAVVGTPHEKWGEMVTAFVVLKPGEKQTEEEIIKFCKGKIASYKCPKKIYFLEALPRTPFGKVEKKQLRSRKE